MCVCVWNVVIKDLFLYFPLSAGWWKEPHTRFGYCPAGHPPRRCVSARFLLISGASQEPGGGMRQKMLYGYRLLTILVSK